MREVLDRLLTTELFALLLIFCRVGSALTVMPGIGELMVPVRVRLLLAIALTILVGPVLLRSLPAMPNNMGDLTLLLGGEIMVGLFIGTMMRLILSALDIAGTIIGFQTGLASASILNPLLSEQGSLPSLLLGGLGALLLFETDMIGLMLRSVVDSYSLFHAGALPPVGDFSETITRTVSHIFRLGLQLSGPFIILITVLMIALGLMARLQPQVQIFFIALPIQAILGFILLAVTLPTIMYVFFDDMSSMLSGFLTPK
jgi:flagellar biosynthetic protein FliR